MSRKIYIDSVDETDREQIMKDLQIKLEGSTYAQNSKPSYIYPLDVTDDHAYIPFSYGNTCAGGPFPCPERSEFGKLQCKFEGSLREHQKEVKTEAISHLNKYGSTIVAAFPGYGKCLGYDTPIIMYDGKIKMVQDIKVGEQVMGDDSTFRNVLSICQGNEQMYDIIQTNECVPSGITLDGLLSSGTYRVNESHILSLKILYHKSIYLHNKKYIVIRFDKKSLKFICKKFDTMDKSMQYRDNILDNDILDIEVRKYLKLPEKIQIKLKGYKVPITFIEKSVNLDPYFLGLWLGDGSFNNVHIQNAGNEIKKYLIDFSHTENMLFKMQKEKNTIVILMKETYNCDKIFKKLRGYNLILNKHIPLDYKCNCRLVQLKVLAGLIDSNGYYNLDYYEISQTNETLAYDIEFMCRSLGFESFVKKCVNKIKVYVFGDNLTDIPVLNKVINCDKSNKKSKKTLVTSIKVVPVKDNNYYGFTLDGNRRFLLGDFTVTHNTALAIYIATKIKLKTLIISHRIILIKQWQTSIEKFCPGATIQVLTPKSVMKDCDFYIMNPANVPKHNHEFYKDIGFMIIDEVHLIMAEGLSKCMQRIVPRYVIGLSATPYREDGLNILLDLYFGKRKIYRKLFRKHTVYRIKTKFVPTVEFAKNGRVNWGVILDSQCNDIARNEMIVQLVKFFPKRVFLVLCKRINQGNYLVKRLIEEGEDVTSLIGKQQEFEQKSRILVGISSKVGTGFDHPRLDALILASDIQAYFIQYLGRCMRTQTGIPLIFDIVDKNPILDKHFRVRRAIYLEHGGDIKDFGEKYPKFEII